MSGCAIVEESIEPGTEVVEPAPVAPVPQAELGAITLKPSRPALGELVEVASTSSDRPSAEPAAERDDDRRPERRDAREVYRLTVLTIGSH